MVAFSALLALAAAVDTTTSAMAPTVTMTAEALCAKKCNANDVCCIAQCYHVPCPSDNQANDTNNCVAACPQGTGSPADTQKYADCEQRCYSSHFLATTYVAAAPTAASPGSSNSNNNNNSNSASNAMTTGESTIDTSSGSGYTVVTGFQQATATSSSATSTSTVITQTGGAAGPIKGGASGAGLLGLALAAFVL
ncbi:Uncharacterized protein PECH_007211 [Penicillium ucsense]|uniref:GPI anchored serine-threonine rich protein n=1 Tax=Penicillium ucsense TaxID=2839758 RepID=A0A8J8WH02_9EURO|nr:Uncharacterized protein PECM_008004 [Penicillium ucsense]KAF7735045.1 Uncharacterized protein PECH_007211 [Penicillium ucsense]